MKTCPYCKSKIQDLAIKCRFCNKFLENTQYKEEETVLGHKQEVKNDWKELGNKNSNIKVIFFEKLINHFLVRPLFYSKYVEFFKNTKLGRFLTVLYILLFLIVGTPIIIIPVISYYDNFIVYEVDEIENAKIVKIIKLARNDIINGMPIKEFDKFYPELKDTDKTIFNQLAFDVQKGMPTNKAIELYPELFSIKEQQKESYISNYNTNIETYFSDRSKIKKVNNVLYFHMLIIILFVSVFRIGIPLLFFTILYFIKTAYIYITKG